MKNYVVKLALALVASLVAISAWWGSQYFLQKQKDQDQRDARLKSSLDSVRPNIDKCLSVDGAWVWKFDDPMVTGFCVVIKPTTSQDKKSSSSDEEDGTDT